MVSRVLDRDSEALRHLAGMGLTLGAELEVVECHPFDGPLILDSGGGSLVVSRILARLVFVEPIRVRREGSTGLPRRATLAEGVG